MTSRQFETLCDADLEQVTGGASIDIGSFSSLGLGVADELVGGILGGVSGFLNGLFKSLGLGGLLKFS